MIRINVFDKINNTTIVYAFESVFKIRGYKTLLSVDERFVSWYIPPRCAVSGSVQIDIVVARQQVQVVRILLGEQKGGLGTEVPSRIQGQSPGVGLGGFAPEARDNSRK